MTRPSRACKIFLTPHPSQPSRRRMGPGAVLATALVRENAALEREKGGTASPSSRSAALDSTTSSKPPASDGLRKKRGQRRTRSQRGKSGRPSGGQIGNDAARTESPDHVVDHDPSACSGCGAPLSDADRHRAPVCRQVFDVPDAPWRSPTPRPSLPCGSPATVTGAVFPDGVTAPVQYGPRITAWVSYLLYAQFVPEKRLAELMSDLFQCPSPQPRSPPWAGEPPGASPSSPMSQT